MTIEVKPIDAPLGAIVLGWNPKTELPDTDEQAIRQALQRHQVLVFRGHAQPADQQLVRFACRFGNLINGSQWYGGIDPVAEILRVNNLIDAEGIPEGTTASASLEWHADYSYASTVGKESFLEAVEIPAKIRPQTCFNSQYAALERLPRAMVEMLRPLSAFHSVTGHVIGAEDNGLSDTSPAAMAFRKEFKAKKERDRRMGISRPPIPVTEHPVIIRHPDTGREILYVSKGITRYIVGMPMDESNDLLKQLTTHSTRPEYVYAHDWRAGDMIMFDTLGTVHRRDAWDPSERRVMRQLSTLWTPPAHPHSAAAE
ncbi:MAG: TauD/TfdA family dioxygenase [Alphaproteobacteria bacterium]